jgi:hypothetical protein
MTVVKTIICQLCSPLCKIFADQHKRFQFSNELAPKQYKFGFYILPGLQQKHETEIQFYKPGRSIVLGNLQLLLSILVECQQSTVRGQSVDRNCYFRLLQKILCSWKRWLTLKFNGS